jgi:hypothetical protein
MSPASAAPPKTVRMNGFRRQSGYIAKNPLADFAQDSLREQLIDLKERLGWTYADLSRKVDLGGGQHAEMRMKTGSFRQLCTFARAMGVRVRIELVP